MSLISPENTSPAKSNSHCSITQKCIIIADARHSDQKIRCSINYKVRVNLVHMYKKIIFISVKNAQNIKF